MRSPLSREHSKEITPPPPLQGTYIPRIEDSLRSPQRCNVRRGLSASPTVIIYLFHSPDLWWKTTGPLVDGCYSLLEDHSLRNAIVWPLVHWTMYDIQQGRWVDIPTFARIDVRPHEFLVFRTKGSSDIESHNFAGMDAILLKLSDQYWQLSTSDESVPDLQSSTSPATPTRPTTSGSIHRHAKRKRSEDDIAGASRSSSPVRVSRSCAKRTRTEEQVA